MDNNQFEKEVGEVIFLIGAVVTLRLLWQRKFTPVSEAILVAVLAFIAFGIGYFILAPSGTYLGMWLTIVVGEFAALYWSLTTHPRRKA